MIMQLFKKNKNFTLNRTYPAPVASVWDAWTQAEMVRQWWGPKNTFVPECRIDARVGGEVHIVMEAGEGMGKYFFSIDLEGHVQDERVGAALMSLHRVCADVRFLGSYPAAAGTPMRRPAARLASTTFCASATSSGSMLMPCSSRAGGSSPAPGRQAPRAGR